MLVAEGAHARVKLPVHLEGCWLVEELPDRMGHRINHRTDFRDSSMRHFENTEGCEMIRLLNMEARRL